MGVLDETSLHAVAERYRSRSRRIETDLCVKLAVECCRARERAQPANADDVRTLIVPSVFLISPDGYVRMLAPGDPRRREPLLGLFNYLSPEAASGLPIDERFDVYVLGAILWELLAGRVLFKGATDYNTVELVRAATIPPLAELNPTVERHLEAIVRTAVAKEPEDRYEHVAQFREALERYLADRGVVSTPYDLRAVLGDADAG